MVVLAAICALMAIVAFRIVLRRSLLLIIGQAPRLLASWGGSAAGAQAEAFRSGLAKRYPRAVASVRRRVDPARITGLLLTFLVLGALYLVTLFSGLTAEILEAQGTIRLDHAINGAFEPWRVEPVISAFLRITSLGGTPAVTAAALIATAFLWPQRGGHMVACLWLTAAGAISTTAVGKLLVARHRPETMLDPNAPGWSFPSGHSTASMAVYGFIAYAIARTLPSFRERFEVVYWAAVLIFLIGFSRVFLGVHYATDVVGGFTVGSFWLLIGIGIAECFDQSIANPPHRAGPSRSKAGDGT